MSVSASTRSGPAGTRCTRTHPPPAAALIARSEAALSNLAVGIVNVLHPARLVVGGSIAEHEPDHVLAPMRRAIAERAFKVPAAAVSLVPSALRGDVSILGAALVAVVVAATAAT